MKVCKQNKRITRQDLANPFRNMSYHERLVMAGIIQDLGNGYCRIVAIDESKLVK